MACSVGKLDALCTNKGLVSVLNGGVPELSHHTLGHGQ